MNARLIPPEVYVYETCTQLSMFPFMPCSCDVLESLVFLMLYPS